MKYFIATVLALIFLIPTYGFSLILLVLYLWFSFSHFNKKMEKAVLYLSSDPNPLGACIDGIHYAQALAYAQERGQITKNSGQYVEFNVTIDNQVFSVTLNREPGGNGAILNARRV